jgi:UDP:flavonoid glycosyltransferase YjiC (YdhE family)
MRVLIVVLPEKGHLHPLIGPAQALQQRGHEVAFYAPRDLSAPLAPAGFTRVFAGEPLPPAEDNRGPALAALLADRERLRLWIRALLLDGVPAEVERLHAVVRDFRPDVIAADPMAYQAPIVAEQLRLPWAGLSTSLNPVVPAAWRSELIATVAWLARDREALFARFGVTAQFSLCDCLSRQTNIVFTTEALVGPPPPGVILAGPSLPRGERGDTAPFDWTRLDDRPLIYLSFGSQNWYQPRALTTVLAAVRGQPWQLVAAVGELASSLAPPSDDVLLVPYAPQLDLYRRAAVAITHGGANSVMEALAQARPLLVTPFCNDQPHNARFVSDAGAGLTLRLDEATPAACRAALDELLAPGRLRDGAARVGQSYAARDGAAVAAAAVEALA